MKKIHKKIISFFLILSISVFFSPVKALAGLNDFSPGDVGSQMIDGILKKFKVSMNSVTQMVSKVNNLDKKMKPPQVSINFSPTNPNPGEKVTATATPMNFGNDATKMYYTWYLRHSSEKNETGTDAIEKFKERAMRIIASNDFEGSNAADSDDDGYKAVFGGEDQKNISANSKSHCFFHDIEKGSDYEFTECKHLFPHAPNEKTGDNSFGKEEETFWKTDPTDSDTADTGHPDEANAAGLGAISFTWTFQSGDEVGVAVEGVSFSPTDYEDASYKVMWALTNNKCDLIDNAFADSASSDGGEAGTGGSCPSSCGSVSAGGYTFAPMVWDEYCAITVLHGEGSCNDGAQDQYFWEHTSEIQALFAAKPGCLGYEDRISECYGPNVEGVGCKTTGCGSLILIMNGTHPDNTKENTKKGNFLMTMDDLNKCLLQNFIDPTEGGASKKIDVSLSSTPKNPVNDPTGKNSDELTVYSNIDNAKDSEFLYYKWEVFSGTSNDENATWTALTKSALDGAGETMGLGLKNFKFKLKFPADYAYLKVKVSVSENAYNGERKGHSEVVIPISSNSNKINVYSANISDGLVLSKGTQKCLKNNTDEAICKVAKNQILAVEASDTELTDFLWTIDKQLFSYKYDGSGKATNPAYFPVAKETGETFNVSLAAINKATGEKTNLSRTFKVVDPEITLTSADESSCAPKLLGQYTDTDNVSWPDYSNTEFEILEGSTIGLTADFTAATPPDNQIEWYVDNSLQGTGQSVSFSADKATGSSYSVAVNALYSQDNTTAKALSKYWDISYDGLYEKNLSATANLTTVGSISDNTAKGNVKKFLASLVLEVPSYLSFLFRIILTTGLMLFAFRVIFVLLPKARKEEI